MSPYDIADLEFRDRIVFKIENENKEQEAMFVAMCYGKKDNRGRPIRRMGGEWDISDKFMVAVHLFNLPPTKKGIPPIMLWPHEIIRKVA